jgi:hypothetical protein
MKQIIFILGLPRSGTTLVQRILSNSAEVKTVPESWLFLPFLSFRKEGHHKAVYGARPALTAINDFLGNEDDLESSLANAIRHYLDKKYPDFRYFCEKTPRNLLYADTLRRWYPEDRYLVINRNPLNVAASIFRTFENGVLNPYKFNVDLDLGLKNLIALNRQPKGALVIRYEDLTGNPEETLKQCSEFLDLGDSLDHSQGLPKIVGKMGDPTGQFKMSTITRQPETEYLKFIDSHYRKRWFLRFMKQIGPEDFKLLGYSYRKHYSTIKRHRVRKPIGIRDLGFLLARKCLEFLSFKILPRRASEVPEYIQY